MKILVTATDSMMIQFLIPHVKKLIEDGHSVDIACSIVKGRMDEIKSALPEVNIYTVNLARSPLKLSNLKGLKQLKKIINGGGYNLVWTNEPVMGVMTRLAAKRQRKKAGLKVLYMAHGFHFFDGAPKKNWIIFYTIEKFMAKYTDVLVTINQMDYDLACEKFKRIKNIFKVHGTGVNFDRLNIDTDRSAEREKLGLTDEDFLIMSVGELNQNKNQKVIIEGINLLGDKRVKYFLAGIGDEEGALKEKVKKYGLTDNVQFLGYTKEVGKYLKCADAFAFPSYREGLGLASIEGMYLGLPLLTSNRHGINDYSVDGETGFKFHPDDAKGFAEGIKRLLEDYELREKIGKENALRALKYSKENSIKEINEIIRFIAE